jgi:predicted nucleotidyltransferase
MKDSLKHFIKQQLIYELNIMVTSTNRQRDQMLDLFLNRLKSQLGHHLKQVILFGSRARGDNAPDSDYDCMAVLDVISPSSNEIIDEIAGEFLYEYNVVFSVFPVSEEKHNTQTYNPLFMNVKTEGIVL